MDTESLDRICEKIRRQWDDKDLAREQGLALCREVIRNSSNAIRATHRMEYQEAAELLDRTAQIVAQVDQVLTGHPDVYHAGFVHDAQKEYAEGRLTLALIRDQPLPDPDDLGVAYAAYLAGLAEAVGELRRHILDRIRGADPGWGEEHLIAMDEIFYRLVSFDYPSAISANLKRTTDVTRSIIEKTRGDLTNAIRQQRLEQKLEKLESAGRGTGSGDG